MIIDHLCLDHSLHDHDHYQYQYQYQYHYHASTLTAAPMRSPRLCATRLVTIATSRNMKNLMMVMMTIVTVMMTIVMVMVMVMKRVNYDDLAGSKGCAVMK